MAASNEVWRLMFQVARRVDCVLRASVKEVGFVPVEEGAEVGCGLEVDSGVVVDSCGGLSWSGAGHHVVRGLFQSMAMEVERVEHAWEERDRGCVQQ